MEKLSCDSLYAQGADAWRRSTARARAWAHSDAEATAKLAGPALAAAVGRMAVAALARAAVSDENAIVLRLIADRCAAVSARRRAHAERYREIIHLASEGENILQDEAGRRRAWLCDALFHRAAASERVSERLAAVRSEVEHALDCEAALRRLDYLRNLQT